MTPEPLAVVPREPALIAGVNVEALLERAVDSKSAVEVLERLMVMRRELKAEAAKAAFDRALAGFQAECPVIVKSEAVHQKNSTAVRYRYAPLDVIVSQVKGILEKHGLSHTETACVETEWVTAVCTVKHCAGHSEKSEFKVPIDPEAYMNAAQKFASALTFAKRYAFCNALGILTGDADDDSQASGSPEKGQDKTLGAKPPKTAPSPVPAPKQATPVQPATPAPVLATEAFKAKMLEKLHARPGEPEERIVTEYFQAINALLPNETLADLKLLWVPTSEQQMNSLAECIAEFTNGDPAMLPYRVDLAPAPTPLAKVNLGPSKPAPPAPHIAAAKGKDPEWFLDFVIPVPRKGVRRDEYLKHPDTIKSLFDARHGNDEDSAEARRRLYGFVANYEAKGWVGRDGKQRPPSQSDIDFRTALDAFADWHEKNHPGEKL